MRITTLKSYIKNYNDLKEYIKRQLGYPIVNIEVTEEQIIDCIQNAIEKFVTNAYSGIEERFMIITPEENKLEYNLGEIDNTIFAVLDVISLGENLRYTSSNDIFSVKYFLANEVIDIRKGIDLISVELARQFLNTIDLMFLSKINFEFNHITKKLYLSKNNYNETILIQYFRKLIVDIDTSDPNSNNINIDILNEPWIKQYATELVRKQWALNLMKYSGSYLPNGLQIDVQSIKTEADNSIQKLEDELENSYKLPPDFFIG